MSIFANSEDPEEMQHNAAFNQGLHCLQRLNRSSGKRIKYVCQRTSDSFLFNLPKF